MIILKGGFKQGLEISKWLKEKGLKHHQDYTWYRRSKNHVQDYDCVVFELKDAKWETMIVLRWS
jgi:hypothetical protein